MGLPLFCMLAGGFVPRLGLGKVDIFANVQVTQKRCRDVAHCEMREGWEKSKHQSRNIFGAKIFRRNLLSEWMPRKVRQEKRTAGSVRLGFGADIFTNVDGKRDAAADAGESRP